MLEAVAGAPVDLSEGETLSRRGRGPERDRTGDEGQLQIAVPVGAGRGHRKLQHSKTQCKSLDSTGRTQAGFRVFMLCSATLAIEGRGTAVSIWLFRTKIASSRCGWLRGGSRSDREYLPSSVAFALVPLE